MIKESAYSVKNISSDAIVSLVLGELSILSMVLAVIASYRYDGSGPAAVGLLGMAGLILSGCGIGFGISAWKSPDGGLLMKRIAIINNVLPFLFGIVFYVLGWIL